MSSEIRVIRESAEYHYLYLMNQIKENPSYWVALHIDFSRLLDYENLITHKSKISNYIKELDQVSENYLQSLQECLKDFPQTTIFKCTDKDLLALVNIENNAQGLEIEKIFEQIRDGREGVRFDYGVLAYDIYSYQKLIDKKFLTAQLFEAFENMKDQAKVNTIGLRRKRRDSPVIMIVEDDHFTASYTTSLLNKEFDVVCAKNGEDAINKYIEHAPDSVFLDVILPGISGQETLKAIREVDPEAFVVMLSVDTVARNIKESSKSGAFGFLKKPFSKERLVRTAYKSPFIKQSRLKVVEAHDT